MTPPKGVSKWKTKFFNIRAVAVAAKMTLRNVNADLPTEDIAVATDKTVDWFPRLKPIELKRLDNNQLWVLRMMLTWPDRRARPVLREKSGNAVGLWRMFDPTFEGKVELLQCGEREGFNLEIVGKFRVPDRAALKAPLPQGKGTYRSCYWRHTDYVVVSDTIEGLGVLGGGAAVGGTAAGSTLAGEKRKPKQKAAGVSEVKRRKLQSKRAGPTQKKPAVAAEPQDKDFSIFDAPSSPPHTTAADAGVPKESAAPFVKVVSDPTVQAEKTVEKTASQIFDTVDSSNHLITPNDADDLDLRFSDAGKQKSGIESQKSLAAEKVSGSASWGAGYEGPPIQPGESELEYYYRSYTPDRSTSYHRPPWSVMQGDDISNDPSACKEILGGLETPFETDCARSAPRELRINQLSTMLVGSSIVANAILEDYKVLGRREEEATRLRAEAEELVKTARAGVEQLEKDRAAFEKQKQTAEWAATAELKQELPNAKAANAALGKEKAAAEAIAVKAVEAEARVARALEEAKEAGAHAAKALEEAKERESRASKALEEENAERTCLNQVVGSLQTREAKLADITARVTVAEERANEAVEARDALTTSFNQLEADREWMRSHGIAYIVKAIMDAPEIAIGIDLIKQRAHDAGFKAGYNRCIGHINVLSQGGYTNERSGFRDVDTEALLEAVVASFYDMSLSSVEKLDACLDATDYVDQLRMLYADAEEENTAGDDQDGAGTSGTK
ncbi:hypothetical protein HanRHA438_Chr04g0182071 [Helianthus annuus]|nr:hypothetical protein HanRHA438_Chr04g0182071 [Helianthus annuus]